MIHLPNGIGLVSVAFAGAPLVVVSNRLTAREARVARGIAYVLRRKGERIVVLKESLIAEATEA